MVSLEYKTVKTEINGQILEYQDIFTPVTTISAIEESDAIKLFRKTKELFDEAGIKFAVVFGSLLGAVRENGHAIKGDQDIDICVWEEDKLRDNLVQFQKKGLKDLQAYGGRDVFLHAGYKLLHRCIYP